MTGIYACSLLKVLSGQSVHAADDDAPEGNADNAAAAAAADDDDADERTVC